MLPIQGSARTEITAPAMLAAATDSKGHQLRPPRQRRFDTQRRQRRESSEHDGACPEERSDQDLAMLLRYHLRQSEQNNQQYRKLHQRQRRSYQPRQASMQPLQQAPAPASARAHCNLIDNVHRERAQMEEQLIDGRQDAQLARQSVCAHKQYQ